MVDIFNIKIIYVPYTNKHKSQIGEFGTHPPVARPPPSGQSAVLCLKVPGSILGQDSCAMFYICF